MKKFYLTTSLLLLATLCFAQLTRKDSLKIQLDSLFAKTNLNVSGPSSTNYAPNFSPLTPNAASFQKHEDYQVNLATGVPDINIPLYTIEEGILKNPIVLRYHAGGHTMSEFAPWVGWGFNLDYGGASLNRSIIGIADDKNTTGSYLYNPIINRNLCDNSADYTFCSVVNAGSGDLDPDLFSFSTPSSGGKFMLRPNDTPFLMPWQAVTVAPIFTTPNVAISGFNVVNPNGTKYQFGVVGGGYGGTESQRVLGGSGVYTDNGITTWQIGQITTLNNENRISFQYQTGGKVSQVSQSWGANMTFDNLGTPLVPSVQPQPSIQTKDVEESNIYKIFFTNGEVEFVPSNIATEPRTDIPESPKLKEIKVYSYEGGIKTLLKSITFHYSYFKDRTNFDGRLKLDSLLMFGIAGTIPQVYRFDYTTNTYSWKYNTGGSVTPDADWSKQDYFGYFNNKLNNHLIDISSYNGITILNGTANRSTDETYVKEGLLNKITYPEGGYTTFDFEANRYKNLGVEVLGGGLRVKGIKHFDGLGNQTSMKYYLYGSDAGDGIGKLNSLWSFPSSVNVGEYQYLSGTNVYKSVSIGTNGLAELSSHDGTPVYYTSVREYSEVITPIIIPTIVNINKTESLNNFNNTNLSNSNNGYIDYTFSYEPDVIVNTPISLTRDIEPWKRGLLLSKSVYKSDNTLLQQTVNTYDAFKFESIVNMGRVKYINQATSFCNTCSSGMPYGFGAFGTVAKPLDPLSPACANPQLIYFTGQNKTGQQKVIQTTERSYSGSSYVETVQNFLYDNYLQQSSMTTLSSKGETLKTTYKYPYNFTTSPYPDMTFVNYITPVVEETSYLDNVQTNRKITDYASNFAYYLPDRIRTKIGSGTEITPIVFNTYNNRGNLTKYTLRNGTINYLEWYGTTTADKGKTDLLKSQSMSGISYELLRGISYDYFSLVGLKTMTDYNGYTTNYSFDGFQRLLNIKDDKGFLLKDFYYHYANQAALTDLGVTPTNTLNYLISRTAREEQTGTKLTSQVDSTTTEIQYVDGLSRPIQSQIWKASPDKTKDLITATSLYNFFGIPYKSILPTPSDVATGVYKSTAETLANAFYVDTAAHNRTVFEPSPLNRPDKQFGAGQAWRVTGNEKFMKMSYLVAGGDVYKFTLLTNGSVQWSSSYDTSSLYSNVTISERGFETIEFKDKQGRVTHKRQQLQSGLYATSAFVYDELNGGRLAFVIPPEAYNKFGTGSGKKQSFSVGDSLYNEAIYHYTFNAIGNLIQRHIPGGGIMRYVYDKNDQIVLENDSKDSTNLWRFTKHDALNRPIIKGILTNLGAATRQAIQTDFDNFTDLTYEVRAFISSNNPLYKYTNQSFPAGYVVADADIREVIYYDDFAFNTDTAYAFKPTKAFHAQGLAVGLVTGTLIRNLETNEWYKSLNFYDYKGRNIQTHSKNHVGGIDRMEYQYRFNGEILKVRMTHRKTGVADLIELYEYSYDHLGRKFSFTHNGNVVAKYSYDAIGRLQIKKFRPAGTALLSSKTGDWNALNTWQSGIFPLGNDNVTINTGHTVTLPSGQFGSAGILNDKGTLKNFGTLNMGKFVSSDLYAQTFQWHIRGNLRGNNLDASGNLTNSLFSFKLGYEDAGFWDGNIGKQEWKSSLDGKQRSFTYSLDGASRIKSGTYASTQTGENYSLNNVNYDLNGNITNLSRNGWKSNNTFGVVDNLNYTYQNNSNKIQKIDDASNEIASFKDIAATTDYTYYPDGSLKSDANKGITLIEYNYLKKQSKITFANGTIINYQYDASGKKIKETIGSQVTDYVGNTIYKNNILYQITHDEGRIVNGTYEYNLTDHLGNLRVAFKDSLGIAKIVQSNAYGAWGEDLPTLKYLNTPKTNNFGYLNREFQVETGCTDLVNRQFDNIIGRFTSQDPIIEGQEHLSLYQYGLNNPILKPDPNGLMPDGGGDDAHSEFFLANLVKTAFYDVKHAIFNTAARVSNSDYRASYATNSDGQEIFETKYAKQTRSTSIKGQLNEVASGALDAMIVSGVRAGPACVGVLAESSETQTARGVKKVFIDGNKHPESATHAQDAINSGNASTGIVDRSGSSSRRRENMKGVASKSNKDRDEFPPAVLNPNGTTSVRHINPSDNRGAGSSIGRQLKGVTNGTNVEIVPINVPKQNQ